jgi:hypothetical protein
VGKTEARVELMTGRNEVALNSLSEESKDRTLYHLGRELDVMIRKSPAVFNSRVDLEMSV